MNSQAITELIEKTKAETEKATADLLKTLEFVPEDRIAWSPSPTARTPLWIVGHCSAANTAFAAILRGEPLSLPADPTEAASVIWGAGRDIATRAEAVQSLQDSHSELIQALDGVTGARLETSPTSPFGALPFAVWMQVPSHHMMGHTRQVDYLQTIWGDVQDH